MSESAALTHARDQVMVEAWHQCVALVIEGDPCGDDYRVLRRCPGTQMEAHHAEKRSAGGGHDVGNLQPFCTDHHAAIHGAGRMTGPFTDSLGRRYYADDVGGSQKIRKVRVYDWRDFQEDLEARFIDAFGVLAQGAVFGKKGQWAMAWAFEEMDRLALWQLDADIQPEDESFRAYLGTRGVPIAESTLSQYINVASTLKAKGVELPALMAAVDTCASVHQFPAGYAAIRDNLPRIRRLGGPEIVELLETTPSSDFGPALMDRIEDTETKAAIAAGNVRVQMDATLTVEIQHTMTSTGSEDGDWGKLEGRIRQAIGKRGVPGSYRFKRHDRKVVE